MPTVDAGMGHSLFSMLKWTSETLWKLLALSPELLQGGSRLVWVAAVVALDLIHRLGPQGANEGVGAQPQLKWDLHIPDSGGYIWACSGSSTASPGSLWAMPDIVFPLLRFTKEQGIVDAGNPSLPDLSGLQRIPSRGRFRAAWPVPQHWTPSLGDTTEHHNYDIVNWEWKVRYVHWILSSYGVPLKSGRPKSLIPRKYSEILDYAFQIKRVLPISTGQESAGDCWYFTVPAKCWMQA